MTPLHWVLYLAAAPALLWCAVALWMIWAEIRRGDRERWAIEARAADEMARRRAERPETREEAPRGA